VPSAPCPEWQYGGHPDCARLLPASAARLLTGIQAGKYPIVPFAKDTRPIHLELFKGLTPPGFDYFAGNYRGSYHKCLKDYEVTIRSDPMVGSKAAAVLKEIERLGDSIILSADKISQALKALPRPMTPVQRAVAVVKLACHAVVAFLTIHPYADGNGHTARALLWLLLFKFGYVPNGWTIDPTIPGYGALIAQHRRGVRDPLEQYVLMRISLARPVPG
jgi:fido (protein-threonine AMPylation protein)